jgi:ferrous iron transport protein B
VPVVPTAARFGRGLPELLDAISGVAVGKIACRPHRIENEPPAVRHALNELVTKLKTAFPDLLNARWVAMRLLAGDDAITEALRRGELGNPRESAVAAPDAAESVPSASL